MNKIVNWVFEKNLFDEYENSLVNAINNNSNSHCILYDNDRFISNLKNDLSKLLKEDDIVIFHGSLQLGKRLLRETSYYPGIYLTLESYECYKYYGYYENNLLNSHYLMMGLNDVKRNKEYIFSYFNCNKIFIRPSNGFKSFTGQCLIKENFEQEFDILTKSYGGLDMDILVLIAPAIELEEEYRFIVVNNEIISGALYMNSNNRNTWKPYYNKACLDKNAIEFANSLLKIYEPDICFTMDICRTKDNQYKLIEINSFCCGSMYGNDYNKVVDAVNKICIDDYNNVFN